MTRTRRAIAGGGVFALQMAIRMVTPLVVSPLILAREGKPTLGAYSILLQIIAYVLLLDLGMSRAIARELAQLSGRSEGEQDLERVKATSIAFLRLTGIAAGVLAGLIAWSVPHWLKAPPDVIRAATAALALQALWMPLRFPLSFYQSLLFARQQVALYGAIGILGDLIRTTVMISLVLAGWGLPGIFVATISSELVVFTLSRHSCLRGQMARPPRRRPSMEAFRRLLGVGLPLSLMSLGDQLTLYSQDVIVGVVFNAGVAAAYFATRTPGFAVAAVLWRLTESVLPGINDLYGRGLIDAFRSAHNRLAGYALGAGLWLGAGVMAFNRAIVVTWVGPKLYQGASMTAAVAVLMPVMAYANISTHFLSVEGKLKSYTYVVLAEGALAVVLSVFMARSLGPSGVMWSIVFTHALTIFFINAKMSSMLSTPVLTMTAHVALRSARCAFAGVAGCVLYWTAERFQIPVPWALALAADVVIGAAGFVLLGLTGADRSAVMSYARHIYRRGQPGPEPLS